jgi:hypothetical protein
MLALHKVHDASRLANIDLLLLVEVLQEIPKYHLILMGLLFKSATRSLVDAYIDRQKQDLGK